ncbi:MAG: hypothetical protein A4E69_03346 [Syntrophus sp. PtaB.Bin138]|nr:MAG: hypothetical protein A4E69_03346 [Syntrophus sp. PtaB.Bin138]
MDPPASGFAFRCDIVPSSGPASSNTSGSDRILFNAGPVVDNGSWNPGGNDHVQSVNCHPVAGRNHGSSLQEKFPLNDRSRRLQRAWPRGRPILPSAGPVTMLCPKNPDFPGCRFPEPPSAQQGHGIAESGINPLVQRFSRKISRRTDGADSTLPDDDDAIHLPVSNQIPVSRVIPDWTAGG